MPASQNARGKIFRLGWGAAYDTFSQYEGNPNAVKAVWIPTDAGSIVTNNGQDVDGLDGIRNGRDLYASINNNTGATHDVFYRRTFTGLVPSINYSVRAICLARNVVGAQCGIRVGATVASVAIDNTFHVVEIIASSDASGSLTVDLVALGVPTGTTACIVAWGSVNLHIPMFGATPFDEAVAWAEQRPGSTTAQMQSGEEDAWTTGYDYFFQGKVRWIPRSGFTRADGSKVTGWTDSTGWSAALRWGQDKQPLILYPDDSNQFVWYPCVLVEPMKGAPTLESDFTRQIQLKLRSIRYSFPEILEY